LWSVSAFCFFLFFPFLALCGMMIDYSRHLPVTSMMIQPELPLYRCV
jgi:hypothetical protein